MPKVLNSGLVSRVISFIFAKFEVLSAFSKIILLQLLAVRLYVQHNLEHIFNWWQKLLQYRSKIDFITRLFGHHAPLVLFKFTLIPAFFPQKTNTYLFSFLFQNHSTAPFFSKTNT